LNTNGQLGNGTTTQQTTPVQAAGLSSITAVSAGSSHSLALKSDGTVWVWGLNTNGQLGDGLTAQRTSAFQLTSITGVTAIAAGLQHSVVLKSDGTVWSWGNNNKNQLGDGTTATQRTSPVRVGTLTGITAIATGDYYGLALKSDGTVWAWGRNDEGQLGDGTTTQRSSPVLIGTLSGATAIATGYGQSLALLSDKTLRVWGSSSNGKLGVVPILRRSAPAISLITSGTDTDQDGLPDAWENTAFGNLTHTGTSDSDGDGLTDIQEYVLGTSPAARDVDQDLLTDAVDSYPSDYYNNVAPFLTILSGNNQTGAPSQFNTLPFDVAVWNSGATAPLVNAPVLFTVTQGGGFLATTNVGSPTLYSNYTVRTDLDGSAQIYFKQPATAGITSQVTAVAGSVSPVTFQTQNSGQSGGGTDSDSDGLGDSWEQQYFGGLAQTAAGNPDNDDLNNLAEFQLGRNPTKGVQADTTGAVNLRVFSPR
jgi:hypothetical protein